MIATLLLATTITAADAEAQWHKLAGAGELKKMKALCTSWGTSPDAKVAAQAQICLAQLAAHQANSLELAKGESGAFIGGGFNGPHVDEALGHLDKAIALTPDDLSIHQGRLFLLTHSGRFRDAPAALRNSLAVYHGRDALQDWLGYCQAFADHGAYDSAVEYMHVLEKKYPNDPDVISNIGAFLFMGDKYAEALPYVKRGAELAPNDPINIWNLGRAYDKTGKYDLARTNYLKALALEKNAEALRDKKCMFADFLEQRGDKTNAAKYRDGNHCGQ